MNATSNCMRKRTGVHFNKREIICTTLTKFAFLHELQSIQFSLCSYTIIICICLTQLDNDLMIYIFSKINNHLYSKNSNTSCYLLFD